MVINLYLDKPEEKETFIMMYISLNGFNLRMSTGLKINPKSCQLINKGKLLKIKNSFGLCVDYNTEIERITSFIRSFVIANNSTSGITKQQLKEEITDFKKPHASPKASETFIDIFKLFISERESGVERQKGSFSKFSTGRIKRYKVALNWVIKFSKDKKFHLTFSSVPTTEFFEKFVSYMLSLNSHKNTAITIIKVIKTFGAWSVKRKYCKVFDTSEWKLTEEEVLLFSLDEEELERLANCALPNEKYLESIRNAFLILCYTGLRYNDLYNLTADNIDLKSRIINVRTEKTDAIVKIPITEKLLKILDRFEVFEFNIISNTHFNKHLKYIAKFADLNREVEYIRFEDGNKVIKKVPIYLIISSHCGRRTFITNALKKGISERLIMKITGHKSAKAFAKYIKLTETEAQDAFMEAFK